MADIKQINIGENSYNFKDEIARIQVSAMPEASSTYNGKVYQYIGTTTQNYTHGYFYECQENSGSYSWIVVPLYADEITLVTGAIYESISSDIPNADDPYIMADNITNFINNYTSGQIGFQGDDRGKIYVEAGNFGEDQIYSSPSIQYSGTLIYNGIADAGEFIDNYKCAAHLTNIMNYILYNTKGNNYGSNIAQFTDIPSGYNEDSSTYYTELNSIIIPKGFYYAAGGLDGNICKGNNYTGFYYGNYVGSSLYSAVWW